MAFSVNEVKVGGYLGETPELKHDKNGKPYIRLSLGTNETWNDANGNKQEKTQWHSIMFSNRQAEILGEHAKKGTGLLVDGSLDYSKFQDKDTGEDRKVTSVRGRRFQFLPGGKGDGQNTKAPGQQATAPDPAQATNQNDLDDDIPF